MKKFSSILTALVVVIVLVATLATPVLADKPECKGNEEWDEATQTCIPKDNPGQGDGFEPVTLCHGTPTGAGGSGPANKWELITVDNQGALNGHLNHPNDIIPAESCPEDTDDPDPEPKPTPQNPPVEDEDDDDGGKKAPKALPDAGAGFWDTLVAWFLSLFGG